MNRAELWHILTTCTRHAVKNFTDELGGKEPEEFSGAPYGEFGILHYLADLGVALDFEVCYAGPNLPYRDTEGYDLSWYHNVRSGTLFADFRFNSGISRYSLDALARSKADNKVLVTPSFIKPCFQRRDLGRHSDFMKENLIMHVAPFWIFSMKMMAELRSKIAEMNGRT